MIQSIVKDLALWIHGLFIKLLSFCANSLLEVMNMDLAYFESNVPIIVDFYKVMVAIGWGLLIGNCIFQCLKAMFAGLGFETESPWILLLRTFLFGFLLFFSYSICDIALSIGQKVIDLIGMPSKIEITLPTENEFSSLDVSWLLIIIIGFIIGIQIFKLFFEIAERYAVTVIMVLFSPLAFAMGGSRSTKDIFSGFIRTFASMLLLLASNVIFLKLVFSALSTMPSGAMVIPWCLLVVGIAKTARKADNLLSKIGMNPQFTGDALGNGSGRYIAFMAARTAMSSAMHSHNRNSGNRNSGGKTNTQNYTGGNNQGGANYTNSNSKRNTNRSNTAANNQQNNRNNSTGTQNQSYSGTSNPNTNNSFSQNNGGTKGGGSNNSTNYSHGTTANRYTGKTGNGTSQTTRNTNTSSGKPASASSTNVNHNSNKSSSKSNNGTNKNKTNSAFSGVSHNKDKNFKAFGKTDTVHSNSNSFKRFGQGERPLENPVKKEDEEDG